MSRCIIPGCRMEAVKVGGAVCPFPPFEGTTLTVPVCAVHLDGVGEFMFLPLHETRGFIVFVYDTGGRLIEMRIAVEDE